MKVTFENLGTVNKNKVTLSGYNGNLTIWFSYETPVAYFVTGRVIDNMAVRKNDWSVTTGKLLNELEPDHKKRLDGEQFEKQLNEILEVIR